MSENAESTRALAARDARSLAPGAEHYTACVGPPDPFDGAVPFDPAFAGR